MSGKNVAYLCECGKKWVVEKDALRTNSTMKCKCGRTIVIHQGQIYSAKGK